MGRPIRYAPSEVRGSLERARHMIAHRAAALADIDVGPEGGLPPLHPPRAARRRARDRALELPLPDRRQRVVPALMAGNAVILKHSAQTPLCAERFAECLREAGLPEGVFQALHLSPRRHGARDPRSARRLRRLHRLGRRRPRRAARRRGALHRHRARARRQGSGLRARTTPTSRTRSRTWSTARSSTPASPAAASSGSTCTRRSTTRSSSGCGGAHAQLRARQSARSRHDARPVVRAAAADEIRAARSPRPWRPARARSIDERGFPASRAGHALPRAAGAGGRRPLDAGDERGELRAGGRHHEVAIATRRRSR